MSSLESWLTAEYPLEKIIKKYIDAIYSWCESYCTESTKINDENRLAARNIIISLSELVEIDKDLYMILLVFLYENKNELNKIFDIATDIVKCNILDGIDLIIKYTPSITQVVEFYKLREIKKPQNMIGDIKELRNILIECNNKKIL